MYLDSQRIRTQVSTLFGLQTVTQVGGAVLGERFWVREYGHLLLHIETTNEVPAATLSLDLANFNAVDRAQANIGLGADILTNVLTKWLVGPRAGDSSLTLQGIDEG